ncbi:GNAT family N-acetyltransferase [Promineifilum sp.]|uniref:GNAT family N-acetyltransferase n=1 Tax=Promineifilum sp. TaxID=2664178 RepID=UPI0035AF23B5
MNLEISTDPNRLDVGLIHHFLSEDSYWAQGRALEVTRRAIANSLCFGAYRDGRQVGFARVVTDRATFAWLADVFVVEEERGLGVGKALLAAVLAHPELQEVRRMLLATRDAHTLYAQFGFRPLDSPDRFMARQAP